ncbi:replication initiation factor domain-containing protein [Fusibacillus kribbianus]|uniref:Replication initiation factor domain-containing protein n=1 Tax=Fusibacillus kribbianus TaxID=3044208 RepID=A0AAP4BAE3_9FIRM|nr:replication initiation factor domain-containing protein [Ruminococcus sp. YH-rum2234]MDI9242624.1 replication initiation factor domain-containing protein [Ruminococcus sp. YH-rum2234]
MQAQSFGNDQNMKNGLSVCCDWIAFTLPYEYTVADVVDFLGFSAAEFVVMPVGSYGYRNCSKLADGSVRILSNGTEEMGIHVDIPSKDILIVLNRFHASRTGSTPFGTGFNVSDFNHTAFQEFLSQIIQLGGHFTRLDLAIDDQVGYFTLNDIFDLCVDAAFSSRFHSWSSESSHDNNGNVIGWTLYFGSRKSDTFLRVYDKKLEQNSKNDGSCPLIEHDWVRWELELKNGRANIAAALLLNGSLSQVTCGILSNYIRFIIKDDNNKTRCTTLPAWDEFISDVEKLSIYVAPVPLSLDDTKAWLKKQVSRSLAFIVASDGGVLDFVYDLLNLGVNKLSARQRILLQDLIPELS